MCIFSRHDVAKDPPLSRMDIISCPNLLIYSAHEARILKHGFLICIQELGDEEMSARTGFSAPEAKRHLLALDGLLHHTPTRGIG
jgi:CheR methyltransferase, SAM binding domain